MDLKDLRFYQHLQTQDAKLAVQVESVYSATYETINSISGCYNNYTMHDMGHGLRVAAYMEDLSCGIDNDFENNIKRFNAFEIALMLLSALLHDIGMFIRPEDREKIKNNKIPYTNSLTFDGALNVVGGNEEEAIKDIVRITHAKRISEYIDLDFNGKTIAGILQLDDKYGYSDDIVNICIAHGENYDYLKNLRSHCTKGNYTYNPQYIAALLRIADYLDLDKQRTPILWYRMMRIEGFSKDEWETHFIVHNEKKFKKYVGDKLQIYFEGKSSNAKIHRKYLAYIDELKAELERADMLLNHKDTEEKYLFNISSKIDDCVTTEGFKYSDLRLNLDYSSITELLMGNNIYGNKRLGLRELIQNSLDACELMKEIQEKTGEDDAYMPQVSILISKENGYVKIKDTGTGMTIDIVKKHFLNVGRSYYKSNEFIYESYEYKPIGQFGIGFLACFLLSENVTVKTKHYNSNEINQIELEKNSEYVVTNTEETGSFYGTEISLDYDNFFEVFSNFEELVDFVQKYFCTNIPIVIKDVDNKTEIGRSVSNYEEHLSRLGKDSSIAKFENIECSKYSSQIAGQIRANEVSRKTIFKVQSLQDIKWYLFNKETGQFDFIPNSIDLGTGYYQMLNYVEIDNNEYERIVASKRNAKSRRNSLLAIGRPINLLFSKNADFSYKPKTPKKYQMAVDNIILEDALAKAGLAYYNELVSSYEFYKPVYINSNKYINLQECYLYSERVFYSENSSKNFLFYNKGIWIKNFYGLCCPIPVALELKAVINYKAQDIKLDVSRNNVISGREIITNEVTKIILKYLLEKESDTDRKAMITSMIDYLS